MKNDNMNDNILNQLGQLKEERASIDTEYNLKEQALRDKAITLFCNTLKEYDLDELLLLPLNSDGEMPDEWDDDECNSSNLVDCPITLLYAGKKINAEIGIERPIITRFGVKDDQLLYHTTIFSMVRDGDLSLSNIRMENWQTDWHPISEYKDNKKLIELLFTFLGHSGNWEYTKEHPECCILHREIDAEYIQNRIIEYSGDYDLSSLFDCYYKLKEVDLTSLDASNATTVQAMFFHCENLHKIDVSCLDTTKCTSFESMFDGCFSLEQIHFGNFKTANGETMQEMFRECKSLKSLDLSSFNTSRCENMEMMFMGCASLTSLDLSNFRTHKLQSASQIFAGCESLTELNLSNWDLGKIHSYDRCDIFTGCNNLSKVYLRNCNAKTVAIIREAIEEAELTCIEIITD